MGGTEGVAAADPLDQMGAAADGWGARAADTDTASVWLWLWL